MIPRLFLCTAGFTLSEALIALLMAGLITGGLLAGRSMIETAEIRSTVTQIEGYNAAAHRFSDKHRYLPGDVIPRIASEAGLADRAGTAGAGDGNGLVEGRAHGSTALLGETGLFWHDLTSARLIYTQFTAFSDATYITPADSIDSIKLYLPEAALKRGAFLPLFATENQNYFQLAGILAIDKKGRYQLANIVTPREAQDLDKKIDDGAPDTGIVQARENILNGPLITSQCALKDNPAKEPMHYATDLQESANAQSCMVRIQAAF